MVAAERHAFQDDLYFQLFSIHNTLITKVLRIAIQTLEDVHSLMLLCLWPVIQVRNAHDTGWNYIGLAIQGATSLGCHHPLERDNQTAHWHGMGDRSAADMDPLTQAMTWLYCFFIGAR